MMERVMKKVMELKAVEVKPVNFMMQAMQVAKRCR